MKYVLYGLSLLLIASGVGGYVILSWVAPEFDKLTPAYQIAQMGYLTDKLVLCPCLAGCSLLLLLIGYHVLFKKGD